MKTFIKENNWLPRGGVMDFGWGNGYVLIPQGNPLHGKDWTDFDDVNVNGGITFSAPVDDYLIEHWRLDAEDKGSWIVGFDTCHLNDSLKRWPKEAVQAEADSLKEQLIALTQQTIESQKEAAMETTQKLVQNITDYINTFSDKSKEFNEAMEREHRTLQQSFTKLCLKWLEHVASENYRFDGRNQDSHLIAKRMLTLFREDNKEMYNPSSYLPFI